MTCNHYLNSGNNIALKLLGSHNFWLNIVFLRLIPLPGYQSIHVCILNFNTNSHKNKHNIIYRNTTLASLCSRRGSASVNKVIQKEQGAIRAVININSSLAAAKNFFSPYMRWNSRYFPVKMLRQSFHIQNTHQCSIFDPTQLQ